MQSLYKTLLPVTAVMLLGACHSVPDHARYIPKDAVVVVGVHVDAIGKKVAWSVITGSKLLDQVRNSVASPGKKEALSDVENAGINWNTTIYLYARPDKRFMEGAKMAAIVPLNDAAKLEAYIHKAFPQATIKKGPKRTQALLGDHVYAGWTSDLLMVMNTIGKDEPGNTQSIQAGPDSNSMADVYHPKVTDEAATAAEMEVAFNLAKDASIVGNNRFSSLENDGHDITMLVNSDALMDSYSPAAAGNNMMGMAMSNALWKSSGMTAGFDFEKGRVTGDMRYYPSDTMKDVAKEFGRQNIDKETLTRISSDHLNMLAGYHLAPAAIKMILDKMGLSGMANLFLTQQNTGIDEILSAFTGDIVVAMNNFRINNVMQPAFPDSSEAAYGISHYPEMTPTADFVFAMKIGNKTNFNKLLTMATQSAGMVPSAPNTYSIPVSAVATVTFVVGDQYFAVSNNAANAHAFLERKGGTAPEVARKEIDGHPIGMYVDAQSLLNTPNLASTLGGGASDSAALAEVRSLLKNFIMNGGEYKGDATQYHASINFMNADENSLLQLLQLAQRLSQLKGGAGGPV